MTKWEYKTVSYYFSGSDPDQERDDQLTLEGQEGWEAVSFPILYSRECKVIFKRSLEVSHE